MPSLADTDVGAAYGLARSIVGAGGRTAGDAGDAGARALRESL